MNKLTYSTVGDNYSSKDPILNKVLQTAKRTGKNLQYTGYKELTSSRGESAFVWDQGDCYMASVLECLGTKNLVADEMRKITGKTYYDIIAYDTVATFINDLTTVGARPLVVNAYWALGDNNWMQDKARMSDFLKGWEEACDDAGCVWGGGETPTLKGIIRKGTVDLAGSAVGVIKPKKNLIYENRLKVGDSIILLKSNGINANGLSLARAVANKITKGFGAVISKRLMFGEAILKKTNIYARLIQNLIDLDTDIHYIINLTGHGMRKLMRANFPDYCYILDNIVCPLPVFEFIQKQSGLSDYEMYQTFNMGTDYALFLPGSQADKAQKIIKENGFDSILAGYVGRGKRSVKIITKNITYQSESYSIK